MDPGLQSIIMHMIIKVIFKQLSLKVLSEGEWGNKNNYTNVSLSLRL